MILFFLVAWPSSSHSFWEHSNLFFLSLDKGARRMKHWSKSSFDKRSHSVWKRFAKSLQHHHQATKCAEIECFTGGWKSCCSSEPKFIEMARSKCNFSSHYGLEGLGIFSWDDSPLSFSRKGSIKDAKLSRPQETHTITTPSSKLRSKMLYYYYATHKANSLKLSSSRSWRKKRSHHQLYANSNRLCVKTLWNFWVRPSSTAKVELLYRKVSWAGTPYQWKLQHQMAFTIPI